MPKLPIPSFTKKWFADAQAKTVWFHERVRAKPVDVPEVKVMQGQRGYLVGLVAKIILKDGTEKEVFAPGRFVHHDRSKYRPHQGKRECARRRRQMEVCGQLYGVV